MATALRLIKDPIPVSHVPTTLAGQADPWATATATQRRAADLRAAVVMPLAELVRGGASITHVAKLLLSQYAAGTLAGERYNALAAVSDTGAVSLPTLRRWVAAYLQAGRAGLLPAHTGRVRRDYGWEAQAVSLFSLPSKPGYADVAFELRKRGLASATESRVKRYLQSLPATFGEKSPARVGPHLHALTRRTYQRRSTDELQVGEIYAGDGHTADCYVAHPNTGKLYRPELTAFIDIKSRFITGWWFTESESAVSTLYALSSAMVRHDHVPGWVYIDRGAGYRARMLSDEATGWYRRWNIETIGALPGNPHGKGWIERWFRTARNRHDKMFAGGTWYCGDDMAGETNRRLSVDVAAGRRRPPSLAEYVDSFRAFIDAYHGEPMDVLGGRSPAQVWAELQQVRLETPAEAVMRPSQPATVQRQSVRLHNRVYYAEALALYDARRVVVEYDLHVDGVVWVRDEAGRLIAEATLVDTIGVLPTSRLEEQRDKRLAGQVVRLERKLAEAAARRVDPITADLQVREIAALDAAALDALQDALGDPLVGPYLGPASRVGAALTPSSNPSPNPDPAPAPALRIDLTDWSPE